MRDDVEDAAGVEGEEQAVGQGVGAEQEVPDALVDRARRLLERHLGDLEDAADLVDEQADRLVVDADDDVDGLTARPEWRPGAAGRGGRAGRSR